MILLPGYVMIKRSKYLKEIKAMDDQNFEQEIDLKDLLFAVFHKWRGIILAAIIVGVLLGGYKLVTGLISKNTESATQEIKEEYSEELDLYKKSNEMYDHDIEFMKEKIKSLEKYYTSSVLMQINPYNKCVATADVFINVDMPEITNGTYLLTSDTADSILKAYESGIKRADGAGALSGIVIKPEYLRELITTNVDYQGNVLTVSVTYKDEAGAKQILDALLGGLKKEHGNVQQMLGTHKAIVMNERTGVTTDQELENKQQACSDSLSALRQSLADKEKALKALKPPALPSQLSAPARLMSGIKYGILGIVLGAFLSIFCNCVVFLMRDKLNSDKELKNRFGLRILGVFAQVPKVRLLMGVDRWIARLEGKSSRKPSEVYEIMAVNVRNYMKEGKKILLLGPVAHDKMTEIAEELRKRLPGVEIQVGQDIEHYAETLRILPEAGQILLVEERGKSKYGEIQNQIDVIRSLDKDIMGCVVL